MEWKWGSDRKTGGKNGSCRVENGEMGTGSDKKGQDKKQIRERDCKIRKVGRQTLECKATLVWTCKKERRLRGKKDDGDGSARQKEKRKAKEKVDGCKKNQREGGARECECRWKENQCGYGYGCGWS